MDRFRVLIAGGGVAALETLLALRELAGDRVASTVIAPDAEFLYRPMTVREPFAFRSARRHDLPEMVADMGAELVADKLAWVDAPARVLHTEDGAELHYDALVLAMGGRRYERFPHATTIDDRRIDEQLHGLIGDIEGGYVGSVAFLIPARMAWPLPIYELALMTARRARDMGVQVALTIVTPETFPLAVFGAGASRGIAGLLAEASIAIETSADAIVPAPGQISIGAEARRIDADRVIALPELTGPGVRGLPAGTDGFLAVDSYCRVRGVDRVYAAGDAADFAIKHGGLATQQADTVALSIAALAGAPVVPKPYRAALRGVLLTGGNPQYLGGRSVAGGGFSSEFADAPTGSTPPKIAAKYLAPYLERREPITERV